MLRKLDLAFIIRHESLLITTRSRADYWLETRVYDVFDLVDRGDRCENNGRGDADYDDLIEVFTGCIGRSGLGSIVPFSTPDIHALVALESEADHEKIETLLSQLRAARDGQAGQIRSSSRIPLPRQLRPVHRLRRHGDAAVFAGKHVHASVDMARSKARRTEIECALVVALGFPLQHLLLNHPLGPPRFTGHGLPPCVGQARMRRFGPLCRRDNPRHGPKTRYRRHRRGRGQPDRHREGPVLGCPVRGPKRHPPPGFLGRTRPCRPRSAATWPISTRSSTSGRGRA